MSPSAIAMIQRGLLALGFNPGPVDGTLGPRTRAAASAWLNLGAGQEPVRTPTAAPMLYQGSARYPVREIVLHCSATSPEWMADAPLQDQRAEIRRWHLAKGWNDIGYHWLIGRKGGITAGRPETVIGAGVLGHNSGVIHICLIGGFGSAATDRFAENFTPAQDASARQIIQAVGKRTQIALISGHNQYAAKACPGFTVSQWLKEAA